MKIWGPILDLLNQKLGMQPSNLQWFWRVLPSENHWCSSEPISSSFYLQQVVTPSSKGIELLHYLTDSFILETDPFFFFFFASTIIAKQIDTSCLTLSHVSLRCPLSLMSRMLMFRGKGSKKYLAEKTRKRTRERGSEIWWCTELWLIVILILLGFSLHLIIYSTNFDASNKIHINWETARLIRK